MVYLSGITLDTAAETPLYQQIFEQYAARIRSGALPPGYRLPPSRILAAELKTHRNTVVRAFEELVAAGFVNSVVGRGTFVADLKRDVERPHPIAGAPLEWASLLSKSALTAPLGRLDRLARAVTDRDFINLQALHPSTELMPIEPFRRAINHVLRTVGARSLGYAPREGLLRLRTCLAGELGQRGLPVQADDLLITSGSQQALDLIARALINPGDSFVVEEPTYSGAINLFSAAGATLSGVPTDNEGPILSALERLTARRPKGLYLMPGGRNPTGTTISRKRRDALIRFSHESGVPLIEDDYVADLDLEEEPLPPPMRALDPEIIYLGTFSKRLIPALRIGFIVCPAQLKPHLVRLKHTADLGTSLLLQHALAEFLERGYLRVHLRKVAPAYRARRDALEAALKEHLPAGIQWVTPRSGFALWLQLPPSVHAETLFQEAQKCGVLVSPGSLSSVDGADHPGIRLAYCAETPKRLAEGAARLGKAFEAVLAAGRPRRAANTQTFGVV